MPKTLIIRNSAASRANVVRVITELIGQRVVRSLSVHKETNGDVTIFVGTFSAEEK